MPLVASVTGDGLPPEFHVWVVGDPDGSVTTSSKGGAPVSVPGDPSAATCTVTVSPVIGAAGLRVICASGVRSRTTCAVAYCCGVPVGDTYG